MVVFVRIYSEFFLSDYFPINDNDFAKNNGNLAEGLELETLIGLKSIHLLKRELPFQI